MDVYELDRIRCVVDPFEDMAKTPEPTTEGTDDGGVAPARKRRVLDEDGRPVVDPLPKQDDTTTPKPVTRERMG